MPNKQLLQSAGDGTAVPAGYVGEVITQTQSSNVSLVSSSSVATVARTLQPGSYILLGTLSVNVSANAGSINCTFGGQTKSLFNAGGITATTGNSKATFVLAVTITSPTVYSFSVFSSASVTGSISGSDQDTTWTAIRIA